MEIIHKIDVAIIGISLVGLLLLIGYAQPLVIAPLNNYESAETEVLFEIEKADKLLIDDNQEFTSPKEYSVTDGLQIHLDPGTYYWKVLGVIGSETRKFTIQTLVDLKIRSTQKGAYEVVNGGNVDLKIAVYNNETLVKRLNLDKEKSKKIEGNTIEGEMK